jgi:hypothetical protein
MIVLGIIGGIAVVVLGFLLGDLIARAGLDQRAEK